MKKRFQLNWGRGALLKVERLLEGGIDINDPVDTFGFTLLHHGVNTGCGVEQNIKDESLAVTSLLLEKGASVSIADCCGRIPLMLAALSCNVEVVKLLLERGSSVTARCHYGKTPLHYTVTNRSLDVATILVDKGASMNDFDVSGESPLDEANELGNALLLEFFKSLSLERKDCKKKYVSILHRAAFWGCEKDVVRLLLKNTDLECKDWSGCTPLITAVRSGQYSIVKLLLDTGANVLAEDCGRNTALHWACKQCLGDIVRLVLQYGASPLAVNIDQQTPFDKAVVGKLVEYKIPYKMMFTTGPVINHLLDYGFCKQVEQFLPNPIWRASMSVNHRTTDKDALDTHSPLAKFLVANDLRRSFAGLPLSMSPYIKEVKITFLPNSLKKRFKSMDLIKRKSNPHFFLSCKREIAIMKTISLSNRLTLFDIIIKPVDQVLPFITSETIEHLLVNGDCADDLPIYWGIVQGSLEVLSYRKSLIESALHLFTYFKPLLPFECIEKVLSYLTVKDLKNIRSITHKMELMACS